MSMIVFFPKQQLLLHALPWMMHIVSSLNMSNTSFCTCAPLFKNLVVMVSWKILWATMCSFTHGHQSKWIFKSSMVCPYYEKCATIRCDKPRWIHNIIKKWMEDKQNASVIGQVNNQAFTTRLCLF